jgi:hypothetical protein
VEAVGSGEEAEGREGVGWRGACGEGLDGGVEEREAAREGQHGRWREAASNHLAKQRMGDRHK